MTLAQKIIKYLALAFAIFLVVTIISGILSALYALSGFLGLKKDNEMIKDKSTIKIEKIDKIDGGIGAIKIDFKYE